MKTELFAMIRSLKFYLLMPILLLQCLGMFSVLASSQPLPADWWQQGSPESILTKAQLITSNLTYLHGIKEHPMGDKTVSLEFFQRKTANGTVEKKCIDTKLVDGHPVVLIGYDLESGHYSYEAGQLIKSEFEENDVFEQRVASKFDHPYEYQMRKPERVGTNDCIVVAQIKTANFVKALIDETYKSPDRVVPEQRAPMFRKMMVDYAPVELDYYIRKSDGVCMGVLLKNKAGEMVSDYGLWDRIQVNVPIPDGEFALPKAPVKIAHSLNEWNEMDSKLVKSAAAEVRSKYAREIHTRHRLILAVVMVPSVLLLSTILWFGFRRTAKS